MNEPTEMDRQDAAEWAAQLLRGNNPSTLLDACEIAALADWRLTGEWTGGSDPAEEEETPTPEPTWYGRTAHTRLITRANKADWNGDVA